MEATTLQNQLSNLQDSLEENKKGLKYWAIKNNSDEYMKIIKEFVQRIEEIKVDIKTTLKEIKEYAE